MVFPKITSTAILIILSVGTGLTMLAGICLAVRRRPVAGHVDQIETPAAVDPQARAGWRMPPLVLLTRPQLSTGRRLGLAVLRGYLVIAVGMVIVRVAQLALAGR